MKHAAGPSAPPLGTGAVAIAIMSGVSAAVMRLVPHLGAAGARFRPAQRAREWRRLPIRGFDGRYGGGCQICRVTGTIVSAADVRLRDRRATWRKHRRLRSPRRSLFQPRDVVTCRTRRAWPYGAALMVASVPLSIY